LRLITPPNIFNFGISALHCPRYSTNREGPNAQTKSPASIPAKIAGTERRARFSYDDLLVLFTFETAKKIDL
jgi:hypothetical protein